MRRLINLLSLLLIVSSCELLEDSSTPKLESAEFYETGDASYPVIAVDETQTVFGFSQSMDKLFVELPEGDKWIIEIGEDNYPSSMYVEKGSLDLLILFSEFEGNTSNVAVINQNTGETEYFYDIEFGNISKASTFDFYAQNFEQKSAHSTEDFTGIVEWWDTYGEAVKKMAGPVIGGIGCGMSAITAVGTGGVATPIAVLSCGSFASSIAGDIVGESSDAGGALFKGGSVVGKYGEMILKCSTANWGQCAMGVAGEIGAIANLMKYGKNKSNANAAKEHLNAYVETGGLAGTWVGDVKNITGGTFQDQYYFGIHSGNYTQINVQSQQALQAETMVKVNFNYSSDKNKLNLTFVRVNIESNTSMNGETFSASYGPYTWAEFLNLGEYNIQGNNSESVEYSYTLKENGTILELGNGEVYHRVDE